MSRSKRPGPSKRPRPQKRSRHAHVRNRDPDPDPDLSQDPTLLAEQAAREADQRSLIAHLKRKESRVADAIVTVLGRADAKTLAAFGVVLDFVASQAAKGNAVNASDLLPRRSR